MKINTLSVFPEIIKNNCKYGVLSKAVGKKLITINNYSFFTEADNNRGIDDEQYGHNPGMVISFEKTYKIFKKIKKNEPKTKFIFLILSILVFSCPTNNSVMEIFFLERIS